MNDQQRLKELLGEVFDALRDGLRREVDAETYESLRNEFIFHMTDWSDDLAKIAQLYLRPDQHEEGAASAFLVGFLYHVIPHLQEAGRLLLDGVPNPFEATQEPAEAVRHDSEA